MIEVTENDLRAALAVERWVADVAAESPFETLDALLDAAFDATPLTTAEIDEAVAHHPRIGEQPEGEGASQAFSRAEQDSADAGNDTVNVGIAAGNAAYENRFGRVFIIRAAGRTRAEILTELERRLQLDDREELTIVGEQLRDIALLRLETTYGSPE